MAKSTNLTDNPAFSRTFRNLSREEIADPEKLDALEAMGLGGQFGWDDLLDAQRVLIVSTAGAGKTHECREQASRLFAAGKAAFFLTLEGIFTNEPRFLLEPAQLSRYRQWLADGHSEAYFFLDSADELLLSHGDFRQALRKLALAIDGQLHRARIVVTSRPIGLDLDAFASELPVVPPKPEPEVMDSPTESFRRLISGETRKEHHNASKSPNGRDPESGVRIVGLTSLSREQIEQLAVARGVKNLADLISEIDRKRAWEFARRPQELIEICSYWNEHGQLGTRLQQVAEDSRGDIERSPMEGMETPPPVKARDRWLSDAELGRVWSQAYKTHRCFGPIVRLLIVTGQRREEVASLSWEELDRAELMWTLPGNRAKNGEPNRIPLNSLAVGVLDGIAGGAR